MNSNKWIVIGLMIFLLSGGAHADLVFSAPPREKGGEGAKTYGALASRLSEVLGEKVVYRQPKNWGEYAVDMRADKYDILFDGPHFTAWRIKHLNYLPVARLPGKLKFVFVAKKGNERVGGLSSVKAQRVCAFASPNLTTSVLLDNFRDEVVTPTMVPISGNMDGIYQGLMSGRCDVAVLRDQYYEKILNDEQRGGLRVVHTTMAFPNQGISVSSRLTAEQRAKISTLLQSEDPSLKPITQRFAKKAKSLVASTSTEFREANRLLEGVVWGW